MLPGLMSVSVATGVVPVITSARADRCEHIVVSRSASEEMVRSGDRRQERPPCLNVATDSDGSTWQDPVQAAVEISRPSAERNVAVAFSLSAQRSGEKQDRPDAGSHGRQQKPPKKERPGLKTRPYSTQSIHRPRESARYRTANPRLYSISSLVNASSGSTRLRASRFGEAG